MYRTILSRMQRCCSRFCPGSLLVLTPSSSTTGSFKLPVFFPETVAVANSLRRCVGGRNSSIDPFPEPFARGHIAVLVSGITQSQQNIGDRLVARVSKNPITVLCNFIQVVEQVDVQKRRRQLFGEAGLHTEINPAVAQLENAVAFVVVNPSLVVELCAAQSNSAVGGWRKHQKVFSRKKPFPTCSSVDGKKPKLDVFGTGYNPCDSF